ncbi:Tubulin polymerization-promoting protein family member 2 [Halotydeus destructor]|nr:Tubulin polymerization-promoting protein family member 2 [Halotydeus destructor]
MALVYFPNTQRIMASQEPAVDSSTTSASSSRPVSAVSTTSVDTVPANQMSFDELFKLFSKFGDTNSNGSAITLSNSDKWMKQAKLVGIKMALTTTDTAIAFKKIAKTKKALTIKEYGQFLDTLAKERKLDVDEIKGKLRSSGPPATTKTTSATASAAVARLTDHTKYTGTHKLRFDQEGKGRGIAGRVDAPKVKGYVQGYKDAGTFDKVH